MGLRFSHFRVWGLGIEFADRKGFGVLRGSWGLVRWVTNKLAMPITTCKLNQGVYNLAS